MNRLLYIRSFKLFPRCHFYTIQWEYNQLSETDQFLSRFTGNEQYREDLANIVRAIQNIGERGARENYFRPEDDAHALPVESNALRLYCTRCTSEVVILGNGGVKTSQKVQDSPDCFPHFSLMKKAEKVFRKKVMDRDIWYVNNQLRGELELEL